MSSYSSNSTPSPSARSESLSTTNKRIRTSKPKVRSGCVTCKARRIKCDEIKPACDRCTKFGRECGGYKVQLTYEERVAARNGRSRILPKVYQASLTTTTTTTTNITPHTHQLLQSPPSLHSHSHLHPSPPLSPSPNYNIPLTPAQIFCIETSLELCRTLDLPIWLTIKSSLSKQHPFLTHAFSAIRLLSKGPPPTPEYLDPQLSPQHQSQTHSHSSSQNPIHYHTHHFLSSSRHAISTGPHQPLLASIICLLVITLETLQFHHEPALSHIQLGLALLPQLSGEEEASQMPSFFVEEVVRAFQMVEAKAGFLDECFRFYAPMPLGIGSPFVHGLVEEQPFCMAKEEFDRGSLDGNLNGSVDGDGNGFEGFVFVDGEGSHVLGGSGGGFGHSRGSSIVVGTP